MQTKFFTFDDRYALREKVETARRAFFHWRSSRVGCWTPMERDRAQHMREVTCANLKAALDAAREANA